MKKIQKFLTALNGGLARTRVVLNGVFGDSLAANRTSLALKMSLYSADKTKLVLSKKGLQKLVLPPSNRICIFAHGSCGSENGWNFKGNNKKNYGSLIQREFGFTPYFLKYNSGLHISTNGKKLSNLLENLIRHYPSKLDQIYLVGHSMGGLVIRSACHYGQKYKKKWVKKIKKIFYLGSPHLGTHLEKLGKLTTTVLNQIPNPVTRTIVSLGDLRSAGVKDLRHGYLVDEDWKNKKTDRLFYMHANKIPLLKSAEHYFICGTLSKVAGSKMGKFFGDGLVHPSSGMGKGWFVPSAIENSEKNCKIIPGISHHHLLRSERVYKQMREWCL